MNILEHENLTLFTQMSEDLEANLTEILATTSKSYKVAQDTVKSLFNHQGKARSEYVPEVEDDITDVNEEDDDPVISTMDEELYRILISEINIFIKDLENSESESDQNRLKALIIKFINTNLYTNFPDLYKPKKYSDLIDEFLDLPTRFKNYYLNVIEELKIMNPNSPAIPKLQEVGNPLLLTESTNIRELRSMSQPEKDVFNRHRKELRKLISPDISYLRERFDMAHSTYVANISKVINELTTKLEEDELMSRFSKIILS